jgi:hypothetical protein
MTESQKSAPLTDDAKDVISALQKVNPAKSIYPSKKTLEIMLILLFFYRYCLL